MHQDRILRISFKNDPITLNPQQSGDLISSAIIFLLYKGLMRFEPNQTLSCDLADSYQILNENRKYIFYLGHHHWSDGTPITAHDFVYSWKRALLPDFPLRTTNFFYYIKNAEKAKKGLCQLEKVGVYAEDDLTLVVEMENPCPYFLELVSFYALFPTPSKIQEHDAYIWSGPFKLKKWSYGKEILLTRNTFCKNLYPSNIDAIHIKIIPNEKKAFALFENNKLDWLGDPVCPLPVNNLTTLLHEKKLHFSQGLISCCFNTLGFPFHNKNLRKAIAYAIPRQSLLQKLVLPNNLLARRFCPTILEGSESSCAIQECEKTAKELFQESLKELGIKRLKLVLNYEATDEFSRLALLLKTYLEDLFKITIGLEPLSFKEYWQRLPGQAFEMILFSSFSQYTDVINFLERFEARATPKNHTGWENPQFKELLNQYRKTADQKKRQKLAAKAETILLEEAPIIPLYQCQYSYLQKSHVKNLYISPIGVMQFDRASIEGPLQVEKKSLIGFGN